MEMNFCRRCGTPLTNSHDHVYTCANGHTIYANSSPCVGIFFLSGDNQQVLLATRGLEPHKGMLDSLGGFLDARETFEQAAIRELNEEAGLSENDYEPLTYLTSGYDEYPYQGEQIPFSGVLYYSRLLTDESLQANDDVASIDWYKLSELNIDRLHAADVRAGVEKLRSMFVKEAA